MNENATIKELMDTSRNTAHLVKQIVAAHLGVDVDSIDLTKLKERE